MALDGSYETKLMRLLIGYFHVSLLQQLALTNHGKAFGMLTPAEKTALESQMTEAVGFVAGALSEKFLAGEKLPSPTVN